MAVQAERGKQAADVRRAQALGLCKIWERPLCNAYYRALAPRECARTVQPQVSCMPGEKVENVRGTGRSPFTFTAKDVAVLLCLRARS